jgi:alpha-L-fucosidase
MAVRQSGLVASMIDARPRGKNQPSLHPASRHGLAGPANRSQPGKEIGVRSKIALGIVVVAAAGVPAWGQNWYESTFCNIHFDHHTHPGQQDLGAGTIPERITEFLNLTRPDFVQYHAKGHPGYATYPTKVGIPNPKLKRDVLRVWRDATRALGLKFTVCYSGGVDSYAAQQHPEWTRKKADGSPQENIAGPTPSLCYNSPYVEKIVIPMVQELIRTYEVDGFWFDGENWSVLPCWCPNCKVVFEKETGKPMPTKGDEAHFRLFLKFHRDSFVRYLEKVAKVIHSTRPGCLFATNWGFTLRQPDEVPPFIDWLSGDVPPVHGLEQASLEARFLSTRGKPYDLMNFDQNYAWSDNPPQAKLPAQLMQEASVIVSNGARMFLWDTPRPDGGLSQAFGETLSEVGKFVRLRQRWCHQTASVPEVAILHSQSHLYQQGSGLFDYGPVLDPVRGAHAALTELHYHTDIVNEETLIRRAGEYATIVVAEQRGLPEPVVGALVRYVDEGGQLLLTGPIDDPALAALCGIQTENQPVMEAGFASLSPHGPWVYKPIYNVLPDGATVVVKASLTDDPANPMKRAGLVHLFQPKRGRVVYVAADVFRDYQERRHPRMRDLIDKSLETLVKNRRLRVEAPPQVEATLRRKGESLIVNLINRSPGKDTARGNYYIESIPPLFNLAVDLEMKSKPKEVLIFPEQEKPDWNFENGRLKVNVRRLDIHRSVVVTP